MSVLAIDIGSSHIKALLADWDGQLMEVRMAQTPRRTSEPGEQSYPVDAIQGVIEEIVSGVMDSNSGDRADTLVFSCLGTAMAPIDRSGGPLGAALAPTDARPAHGPGLDETVDMDASELFRRTGSDPGVASFLQHAKWWQHQHPGVAERTARYRSLRGYALQELCGADVEDRSWASRTMLVDLETGQWSKDILAAADLSADVLPPIEPPTATFEVLGSVTRRLGLAPGAVAVLGGLDNGCSLFGADGPGRSGLVNIVGTFEHMAGAAGLAEARTVAAAAGAIVHAYVLPGSYIAMTRVPMGALLASVADAHPGGIDALMRDLSDRPTGSTIPLEPDAVVEALEGGRSPGSVLQGLIEAGAAVHGTFVDAWDRLGLPSSPIAAVGGAAAHEAVLRLKAELLGRQFVTLQSDQAAGLGALRLAAMARQGMDASDASALFANPVIGTISPPSDPTTTEPHR